jgi:uroporphyrinogen-III decarboxylase
MYHQYEKKSGGVLPPFRCSAPFTLAANIRGISSLLVDIFMTPDFVRELLTRITEKGLAPWLLRIKEEFPHLTEIGADDALGSLPIVSPQIMQEWVLPAALDLKERVGPEVSVPNWVGEHCLEDPGILLDMKKQVCHNFIRVQDPDVEKFGPAVFKEYARAHDIHLCLGVGAAFLDSATPAQVAERVKHYLQAGAPGGRMTLYLCALSSATPRENVHAAIRAVREYGTY